MELEIVNANIVNIKADAIVCPSNLKLAEGPGVSAAIFQTAGKKALKKDCDKIVNENKIRVGGSYPTAAHKFSSKYIIHTVVPLWMGGEHNEYELLCESYLSSLEMADQLKCKSVAFPLLASGNMGFDKKFALDIATECIKGYNASCLETATLVLFGNDCRNIAENAGFKVKDIPVDIDRLVKKADKKQKNEELLDFAKIKAEKIINEDCYRALEKLDNPENRDKIYKCAKNLIDRLLAGYSGDDDIIKKLGAKLREIIDKSNKEENKKENKNDN